MLEEERHMALFHVFNHFDLGWDYLQFALHLGSRHVEWVMAHVTGLLGLRRCAHPLWQVSQFRTALPGRFLSVHPTSRGGNLGVQAGKEPCHPPLSLVESI